MTEKAIGKLMKASDIAANDQMQHIVIMMSNDGQFVVTGSANFTEAIKNTADFSNLKGILIDNKQKEGVIGPSQLVSYPLLPCSPYSPAWKGNGMIRSVLTRMLARIGYGDGGRNKKLGVGNPPFGWPENISWQEFNGSTRSKLSVNEITQIIISMLEAAQLEPHTHVKEIELVLDVIHEPNVGDPENGQNIEPGDQNDQPDDQNNQPDVLVEYQPAFVQKEQIAENQPDITLEEQNIGDMPAIIHELTNVDQPVIFQVQANIGELLLHTGEPADNSMDLSAVLEEPLADKANDEDNTLGLPVELVEVATNVHEISIFMNDDVDENSYVKKRKL